MQSAVETLNPTRVRLTVEVPFEELKPAVDSAYRRIAQQVTIPGFRRGKVPPRLIDQRFGRGLVLEEAVNDALPGLYGQAVEQSSVQAIGSPDVEVTEVPDPSAGGDLKFTVEVDVVPQFELPAYDDLAVTVDDAEVTDRDVDEQLEALRERFGALRPVERPAQEGDFLTLDITATADGEELDDLSARGLSYRLGSGDMIPGLDEAVAGAGVGESRTFSADLAGRYAGRTAKVTATVTAVRERDLPELDDEFAMTASEFDTLEELRADLRTRLGRAKLMEQGVDARDRVLEALLQRVEVPLPESVVRAEVEGRQHNLAHQLEHAGLTKADYLRAEGREEADFDAEVDAQAREAVKAQFVLDAVARQQQIGVEQVELTDHLVRRALSSGMRPEEFAQQVVDAGQVPLLMSEVVRAKALAQILETATITDASGRPVDLERITEDGELAEDLDDEDGELAEDLDDEDGELGEGLDAEGLDAQVQDADADADAGAEGLGTEAAGDAGTTAAGDAGTAGAGGAGAADDVDADPALSR